jgi:hypothetical protein
VHELRKSIIAAELSLTSVKDADHMKSLTIKVGGVCKCIERWENEGGRIFRAETSWDSKREILREYRG